MIVPPIPPTFPHPLFGLLAKVGKWILKNAGKIIPAVIDAFSSAKTAKDLSDLPSEDYRNAPIDTQLHINSLLSNYKTPAIENADRFEDMICNVCEETFGELIEFLEDNDIPSKNLQRAMNSSFKTIRGILKNAISSKISLGNSECMQILEMSQGEQKEQKIKTFINGVLINGLQEIKKKLAETSQSAFEGIKELAQTKLEGKNEVLQRNVKNLEELRATDKPEEKEVVELGIIFELWKSQAMLLAVSGIKIGRG